MRSRARLMYRQHYELVRKITPRDRLLEYQLGSGWEPLCQFLGKPIPEEPFPRSNDQEAFREMLSQMMWKSLGNATTIILLYVTPLLVLAAGIITIYAW